MLLAKTRSENLRAGFQDFYKSVNENEKER